MNEHEQPSSEARPPAEDYPVDDTAENSAENSAQQTGRRPETPFDYFQEQWNVSNYFSLSQKEKARLFDYIEASMTGEEYRRPREYTMENLRDDMGNFFV
jgi:hypothetical protein